MKKNKCGDLGNYVQNVVDKIDNNTSDNNGNGNGNGNGNSDGNGNGDGDDSNPSDENSLAITSAEYSTKTTNSITVTACATDENNQKLTYKIYTRKAANGNTPEETEWTERGSLTDQTAGETVTLVASGLDKYTEYYWKVSVTSESISSPKSAESQNTIRTYCPGPTTVRCSSFVSRTCGATYYTYGTIFISGTASCGDCGGSQVSTTRTCSTCGKTHTIYNCSSGSSCTRNRNSCNGTVPRCAVCGGLQGSSHTVNCGHTGYSGMHD